MDSNGSDRFRLIGYPQATVAGANGWLLATARPRSVMVSDQYSYPIAQILFRIAAAPQAIPMAAR